MKTAINMCEEIVKSDSCQNLLKENPLVATSLKRCTPYDFCVDSIEIQNLQIKGCAEAYWQATKEFVDFFSNAWDSAKNSLIQKNNFLRNCNNSVNCKRSLIQDNPRFNQLSDEKLDKYSATYLEVEMSTFRSMTNTVQRQSFQSLNLIERQKKAEELRQRKSKQSETPMVQDRGMIEAAKDWLWKQKINYSCFNAKAQAEMLCYAAAQIIDPTMAAGMLIKVPRLAFLASKTSKIAQATKDERRVGSTVSHVSTASRDELKAQLLHAQYTTVEQNKAWISLADSTMATSAKKTQFVEIENSKLKTLNDTLKDKDLVTSMTNMHKQLVLEEIEKLKVKYPNVQISPYSDFKSIRFAIEGDLPKGFQADLQKSFETAQNKFTNWADKNKLVRSEDRPESWFKMGTGKTADEASSAARYSRESLSNSNDFANPLVQKELNRQLEQTEKLRQQIASEVGQTKMIEQTPSGEKVLTTDAFEILRKAETPEVAAEKLKAKFGLSHIGNETVQKMMQYSDSVDKFSPSLRIAKREVATLDQASLGGFSVDFIGLGAKNLQGTASALAGKKEVSQTLVATRKAEQEVTELFQKRKDNIQDLSKSSVGNGRIETICSGDDCIGIAKTTLTESDKQLLIRNMAREMNGGNVRVSFIAPGIQDTAARTQIATHGEAIEKILRSKLDTEIEPQKLRGLVFGVDMQTTKIGQGETLLLVGKTPATSLSGREQIKIQSAFQEAVKTLNEELKKSGANGYRAR